MLNLKRLNLGIIYKNNKVCNHRSLLKTLLNPFLRMFGFQIATLYYENKNKLGGLFISKCDKQPFEDSLFSFELKDNMHIVKKRILI